MVVTALVGLFITVIIYISKIFNVKSEVAEIHEIKEQAIPEEKPRKKSESVGQIYINKSTCILINHNTFIFLLGYFKQKVCPQEVSKREEL